MERECPNTRRGAIGSFSHDVDSTKEKKSRRLRGDSHLDVGEGGGDWWRSKRVHREEKREREFSVSGADGREVDGGAWASWPRSFQDPSVPRFNFLRGLISPSPPDTKPKYQPPSRRGGFQLYRGPPQCRLSRSVKSRHPRLKKLIRYLAALAPQSRGNWKGQCRETKYEGGEKGIFVSRERERKRKKQDSRDKKGNAGRVPARRLRGMVLQWLYPTTTPKNFGTPRFSSYLLLLPSVFHQDTNKNALSNPFSSWTWLLYLSRDDVLYTVFRVRSTIMEYSGSYNTVWFFKK